MDGEPDVSMEVWGGGVGFVFMPSYRRNIKEGRICKANIRYLKKTLKAGEKYTYGTCFSYSTNSKEEQELYMSWYDDNQGKKLICYMKCYYYKDENLSERYVCGGSQENVYYTLPAPIVLGEFGERIPRQ
jgi:hypothetical protein